jgi:hypothetical protein
MKKGLAFIFFFPIFYITSFANEIPNCWDNKDYIKGYYLITIETDIITKEDFIEIIKITNGINIKPQSYPFIYRNKMMIRLKAVDSLNYFTEKQLREEVENELFKISKINGTIIECNAIND